MSMFNEFEWESKFLKSQIILGISCMVGGVFSDQEMKNNDTEPATTSQRRNAQLSSYHAVSKWHDQVPNVHQGLLDFDLDLSVNGITALVQRVRP